MAGLDAKSVTGIAVTKQPVTSVTTVQLVGPGDIAEVGVVKIDAGREINFRAGTDRLVGEDRIQAVGESPVAAKYIVVGTTKHDVVASASADIIVTDTAIDVVRAGAAIDVVRLASAEDPVGVITTPEDVFTVSHGPLDGLAEQGTRRDERHRGNQSRAVIRRLVTGVQ